MKYVEELGRLVKQEIVIETDGFADCALWIECEEFAAEAVVTKVLRDQYAEWLATEPSDLETGPDLTYFLQRFAADRSIDLA